VAETCRATGVNAILLETEATNPRATALYERAGYQSLNRRLWTKILNPGMGYKPSVASP
jgi:ribosomal protein S18 acetylase RimI-like enzyme